MVVCNRFRIENYLNQKSFQLLQRTYIDLMDAQERIMVKATELFTQRGIKSVTVDQICQGLGISKRTMYEIFKDKNDLVNCVIASMAEESKRRNFQILDQAENVMEAMFALHNYSMSRMNEVNVIFYEDLKKYYPQLISLFFPKASLPDSFFYTLISKGREEGIFRSDINPAIVAEFLQNLIIGIFHSEKVLFECKKTSYEIQVNIMAPYFRGISTEKGLRISSKYEEQILRDLNQIG